MKTIKIKGKKIKIIELEDIFEEEDLKKVVECVNRNHWSGLRKFLNSIQNKLDKKEILADYLYFCLFIYGLELEFVRQQHKGGKSK